MRTARHQDRPPRSTPALIAGLCCLALAACQQPAREVERDAAVKDAGSLPEPSEPAWLANLRARGALRVLILQPEAGEVVPREGDRLLADRARAEALAARLDVDVEFVPIERESQLVPALLAGRGDLIGTPLRADAPVDGIAFSKPVRHVQIVAVSARKDRKRLRKARHLSRFELVRTPTLSSELLDRLGKQARRELTVVEPEDPEDIDEILFRIGTGKGEAAVTLSHHLDDYLAYRKDVRGAFTLGDLPIALAVPAGQRDLLDFIDAFLAEYLMTPHLRQRYGGDLADIKQRRVIRVAMLNNAVAYFIYRGQQVGFQFDLAELLSMRLGVRLEVVVPKRPGDLLRMLTENRADVAVVTPNLDDPLFGQCGYSLPIDHADQVLVQPADQAPLSDLEQLAGKTVNVRRSSQYYATLKWIAKRVSGLRVVAASEDHETEELIRQVGQGEIPLTVANSALLQVERSYRDDIQGSLVLARARPLVFAVRAESRDLLERLNRFVLKDCSGPKHRALLDRYFGKNRRMAEVRTESLSATGAISPYDELVKAVGREFDLDWRLILAQMYQESRFDPRAVSWAGARGLLQVMPETGRELGLKDPWDPEQNVRAGVGYLKWLISRFEPTLPERQRIRFALASYNAGLGHVRDARRLARARRLDPDRWFDHVEKAIVLLEKPKYHRRAKHGYCRGSEPVQYVSRIQDKYDAFSRLAPALDGE